MPEKNDYVVFCKLSLLQRKAYERLLELPEFRCLAMFEELCDCGSCEDAKHWCAVPLPLLLPPPPLLLTPLLVKLLRRLRRQPLCAHVGHAAQGPV